jgi:ribosomal protein L11 methyltransferase
VQLYKIHFKANADLEAVWNDLEAKGWTPLYSETADDGQYLFASLSIESTVSDSLQYPEILGIEKAELPGIDWESQWAMHPDYREGFLHVDLLKYTSDTSFIPKPSSLKLVPGPGFGDMSHPTTRLVLSLMVPFVPHQHVVDIGCGSGILSFAAVGMGAQSVCGIDIDSEALAHAQTNSGINEMEDKISFVDSGSCQDHFPESVILMNMIQSEQEVAWGSLKPKLLHSSFAITSGILQEGRDDYLKLCEKWGWKLVHEKEEEEWIGFVFKTN